MKIDRRVESIFSQAVALEQSGKEKSIIFCKEKNIYIKNMDNTLLLKFQLGKNLFPTDFSFKADDYDSSNLRVEEDGGIVFINQAEGYVREKKCKVESESFSNINKVFMRLKKKFDSLDSLNEVVLKDKLLVLLDKRLSHIEFFYKKKNFRMVQKDIYSGTTLTIRKEQSDLLDDGDKMKISFDPIGLRTNDFMSLFMFSSSFSFYFGKTDFVFFKSPEISMCGFLSCCLYDELGEIKYI